MKTIFQVGLLTVILLALSGNAAAIDVSEAELTVQAEAQVLDEMADLDAAIAEMNQVNRPVRGRCQIVYDEGGWCSVVCDDTGRGNTTACSTSSGVCEITTYGGVCRGRGDQCTKLICRDTSIFPAREFRPCRLERVSNCH